MATATNVPIPPPMLGREPDVELSVVMPCLNEARTLARCIDKAHSAINRLGISAEVVVADNGSTDGSPDIARLHGARVLQIRGTGYGIALRGAIKAARGRYIIMGDADDSYDFTQLDAFLARLRAGDDLVLGNRFKGGIRPGAMPWHHRHLGNPALTGLLNLLFGTRIGDAHCGLRAFNKDSSLRLGLVTSGMEFASEMVVKAAMQGQKISEVPIILYPDGRGRPPHLRSFRDGWRHLRFLLLMSPQSVYLIPALLLLTSGLASIFWLESGTSIAGASAFVLPRLLVAYSLLTVGYQVLWLWAFAEAHTESITQPAVGKPPMVLSRSVTLGRGLALGIVLLLAALALSAPAWRAGPVNDLDPSHKDMSTRYALWTSTTLVCGAQTIYGICLLATLRLIRSCEADHCQQ